MIPNVPLTTTFLPDSFDELFRKLLKLKLMLPVQCRLLKHATNVRNRWVNDSMKIWEGLAKHLNFLSLVRIISN